MVHFFQQHIQEDTENVCYQDDPYSLMHHILIIDQQPLDFVSDSPK